jgi:hypothetical protein
VEVVPGTFETRCAVIFTTAQSNLLDPNNFDVGLFGASSDRSIALANHLSGSVFDAHR